MSKSQKIILVVLVILVIVAGATIMLFRKKDSTSKDKTELTKISVSSSEELVEFVKKLYKSDDFPMLETTSIDVKDKEMVNQFTNLENGDDLEYLVVSEPLMSSQAYSLIIAKVKNGNADKVAKELSEKLDMNKWICVSAEKLYATSSGDYVFLVMSDEEWATEVYDEFKKSAGTIGKEYVKEGEVYSFDDWEIEPDFDAPVASDDGFLQ